MRSSAVLSTDDVYRYELRREWDQRLPPFIAIMLNPSKADKRVNDPTITRLIRRAAHDGYGSLIVGNIGAGRNTSPKRWAEMKDPVGPSNRRYLRNMLLEARDRGGKVLVGWGPYAPARMEQDVLDLASHVGVKLYCLGLTKNGHPRHPLYVAYEVKLQRFLPIEGELAA